MSTESQLADISDETLDWVNNQLALDEDKKTERVLDSITAGEHQNTFERLTIKTGEVFTDLAFHQRPLVEMIRDLTRTRNQIHPNYPIDAAPKGIALVLWAYNKQRQGVLYANFANLNSADIEKIHISFIDTLPTLGAETSILDGVLRAPQLPDNAYNLKMLVSAAGKSFNHLPRQEFTGGAVATYNLLNQYQDKLSLGASDQSQSPFNSLPQAIN